MVTPMNMIIPAVVLLCAGTPAVSAETPVAHNVEVYSHRGGRAFNPENTMPAYRATLRLGTDWVDMDVVLTQDGEILISHDPLLNPDIVRDAQGHFLAKNKEALQEMSPADRETYT